MGYCSARRRTERDSRLLYYLGKNTAEVLTLTSATPRAIWTTIIQFCLNGNDSRWRAVSSKWDLVCTVCPFVCFHIRRRTCKTCPYESTLYRFVAGILFPDVCVCNRINEWIQAHRHQSRAWALHIEVCKAQPRRPWRSWTGRLGDKNICYNLNLDDPPTSL